MNPAVAPLAEINPWLRAGPCTPVTCVEEAASQARAARRAARILAAALVLLAGVPVALALRRSSPSLRARATRRWARLLLRALGVAVEVTAQDDLAAPGRSPGGVGTLFVANHVSWLDPLVMAATAASRPLAKREVGEWPVVRTLVSGSGALFIDRERLSALPAAVAAVAGALRAGDGVVAFPEGTTWCGRGMGGFRPAVFQAAIDAGAPVRPAALRYREGTSPSTRGCYVGEDSLLASLLRVVATRRLTVEVVLFAPLAAPAPGVLRHRARAALAGTAEDLVRSHVTAAASGSIRPPAEQHDGRTDHAWRAAVAARVDGAPAHRARASARPETSAAEPAQQT
ncbi:lysophospholipid acyltransferase family protein [Nonomuraea pusilla]|uniref:lysophospholipid acyltransferase family protein n=1 Tax=Nonomuraea pusilla TaxID=46177 RepID=UPI00331AA761